MSVVFIYVTAGSRDEALAIANAMVEERLAACANVLDGMTSVYRWQGKLASETETVLILKTRQDLAEAVIARVKALHSYECPCVVVLPVIAGNPAFLEWIAQETA